jgi:putative ABC transport system ATP-binding protein
MAVAPVLDAHELYRFFHIGDDETLALRGVSLSIEPAETIAITGPSGSGKSTLVNCLAGLDEPDGGWVTVAGHRMTRRSERERARLRARMIGVLLQSGNLLEHLTVTENMRISMSLGSSWDSARTKSLLDLVGLGHRADALPSTLSGGELARASLLVALSNDPAILIADEPTGEVDAENEARILSILSERAQRGGANLIVTHSARVASTADRVIHLVDGRICDRQG